MKTATRDAATGPDGLFLIFNHGVDDAQREAVKLCVRAAELHARRAAGPFDEHPQGWFDALTSVLSNLGWITAKRGAEQMEATRQESWEQLTVDAARSALATARLPTELRARLGEVQHRTWPFCLGVASVDGSVLVLDVLLLVASTSSTSTKGHGRWRRDARAIGIGHWCGQLNMPMYESVRAQLQERLRSVRPEHG